MRDERTRPAKEDRPYREDCEPQGCCAMRPKVTHLIEQHIKGARSHLAGLEKLQKLAELASDDPDLEQLLWSLVERINEPRR